jgi:hypothetical protein
MVSVEDTELRGAGHKLKQAIWDAARETISEWTGQELTQCSLYGIRVYQYVFACNECGCALDRLTTHIPFTCQPELLQ